MARPRTTHAEQTSYKALTYVYLPILERQVAPGETITADDLEAAGQTAEDIKSLVDGGAIGGEDDPINAAHIIPDANMPTISSVVEGSRTLVAQLEAAGEEVPAELRAVADLDYTPVSADDEGKAGDVNA